MNKTIAKKASRALEDLEKSSHEFRWVLKEYIEEKDVTQFKQWEAAIDTQYLKFQANVSQVIEAKKIEV